MRPRLLFQARNSLRCAAKCRYGASYSALRWSSTETRQWSTPLAKQLSEAITATGPIPLASFMRMCLTSDVGGYYTAKQEGRDQFGKKGDFITSPEISQIFGELVGIWFVAEWMSQGKKKKGVELIEIGPGRGTLMDDMLRTIKNFKPMAESIEAVYMVEASLALRDAQKQLLCGDAPMIETETGFKSTSKYAGIPIMWTENMRSVPYGADKTPFIVAHEFFDALPIHVFQSVAPNLDTSEPITIETPTGTHPLAPSTSKSSTAKTPQWREMVVSPTPPNSTQTDVSIPDSPQNQSSPPEFQLTLSKSSTPHSLYLPEILDRYRNLKSIPDSLIEISPESHAIVADFASRIGGSKTNPKTKPSGAALILDYGPISNIPTNSLRGIKAHQRVSPFSEPGIVDLSADVDFVALAEAAMNASEGVEIHGPMEQGEWLLSIGIKERAEMLVQSLKGKDDEARKRIEGAWRRLVDMGENGMGKVYKVMIMMPENEGRRPPLGFGGSVVH